MLIISIHTNKLIQMVFNTLAITLAKISKVADKENLIIIMVKDKHN